MNESSLFFSFSRILNQNRGDTFVNLPNKTCWNQWCLLFCAGKNTPNQTEWGLWHRKCDMSQSTHFWAVLQQVNWILDTQSGNFKKHTIWANIAAELVVCNMKLPLEPKWQKQKKQTCLFDAFGTLSRSNSIDRWSESDQALTSTVFVLFFKTLQYHSGLHGHILLRLEQKQCKDVTSRGVSGHLMRQFIDRSTALATVREPLLSAN